MTRIGLAPITIGRDLFNTAEIRRIVSNSLKGMAKSIKVDFKVTVRTWNNKPVFVIDKPGEWTRIIGTHDDVYKFVSGGTKVRYAIMTPDFVPKSRVKVIGSRKGRGGFSRIDMRNPKPGIKAREFDITIAKKWLKLAPNIIERAIMTEITKR